METRAYHPRREKDAVRIRRLLDNRRGQLMALEFEMGWIKSRIEKLKRQIEGLGGGFDSD